MEPVQPDGLGRLHVHGRGERGGQERRHAAGDHRARGQPRMLLRHQVLAALLSVQHPAFPRCLAKMVESAAVFYSDPNTDKVRLSISAVKRSIGSTTGCTITEKAPTRAFSWLLKAPTSAFTFKTLLRHYAKQTLTPR